MNKKYCREGVCLKDVKRGGEEKKVFMSILIIVV
jgi:hypothetical protein